MTRTVSVSTRLVLKGPRTQFRSQPSSPRGSPPDNRRAIKSAQQSGGSLDYDVSGAGTQYPAITYGPQPSRVKDKNLGTPQVPTDEAYTSTSSFVQQKSEKVTFTRRVSRVESWGRRSKSAPPRSRRRTRRARRITANRRLMEAPGISGRRVVAVRSPVRWRRRPIRG